MNRFRSFVRTFASAYLSLSDRLADRWTNPEPHNVSITRGDARPALM